MLSRSYRKDMSLVNFTIIISHSAFRDSQFDSIVENETCVVKFYADWCPPCRAISPEFTRLSLEYSGGKFLAVNVDQMRSVSRKMNVNAMPTFIFFEKGKEVGRITGADVRSVQNHVRQLFTWNTEGKVSARTNWFILFTSLESFIEKLCDCMSAKLVTS